MISFKNEIAKSISKITNIEEKELESYIEIPPNNDLGDYAFPCFKLAKTLRKAPNVIAQEIKEQIDADETIIERIEIIGGYLNIYINKEKLVQTVVTEISEKKECTVQAILDKVKM